MKKLILFIFMMSLFLLPGCKKYPDGPLISFKSPENRIKGQWWYDHYYEDDKDLVNFLICDTCFSGGIDFTFDSDGDYYFSSLQSYTSGASGRWDLVTNSKYINFFIMHPINLPIGPLFNKNYNDNWRIRRLTTNEFWITCDYNNKHYELNLYK